MQLFFDPKKKRMENRQAVLPGYRLYEYRLVLGLPEELRNRTAKIKQEFAEKYKTTEAGTGKPTITLVSFTQYAMLEERILHRLETIAMGSTPFKAELKDFGSFPSHTIYIPVTSKVPVQQLVKTIRSEAQRLLLLKAADKREEKKPHFILEPHIIIARKLKPWQYEKGWLEYSHRHFTGRFIAEGMTLLRRPEGETKYQAIRQFAFQNLPVTTKQGELFGG